MILHFEKTKNAKYTKYAVGLNRATIKHLVYARYTAWSKKLEHFFVRLNFIKYFLIFKLISLSESG